MATRGKPPKKKTATTSKASATRAVYSAVALRALGKRRHDLQKGIEADRKNRADDYFKRIKPPSRTRALGLPPPSFRIFAEGDSWFDYPSPGGGVVTHLGKLLKKAEILNLAHAGDALRQMLSPPQRGEIEERLDQGQRRGMPFDALLFSGGGNDIVGDQFSRWLLPFTPGATASDLIDTVSFGAMLTVLERGYSDLSDIRKRHSESTTIFVHGYDYAKPTGKGVCWFGPWLRPSLEARGIVDPQLQFAVVKEILVRFRAMLQNLVASLPNFVYVETQGLLPPTATWWENEIHPTPRGFEKIAVAFKDALVTRFPQLA
ncbi:MAG: hypothetical protein HY268_05350 [Deltaproteobacteria bacterium]|nr:hypothetical protein [Deltaproteobacteria bacterium]